MSIDRLDPGLLQAADAAYKPIASFDRWLATQIDEQLWDDARQRLAHARGNASSEDLRRAIATTMRAAAIDTGAIEGLYDVDRGFTISVATQSIAWQAALNEKGPSVRELFEAQLQAYELALDAATRQMPITEAWIRRLHEELCRPQPAVRVLTDFGWQDQQFEKGRYKSFPNHPWTRDGVVHSYAPVSDTPAEMHRLVEQLRSPAFERSHAVLQAAYTHYCLVAIHPFQDGNGRVARALASVYLYRAASIPLVIFNDQKQEYFEALAEADNDRHQTFADFILERAVDAMQVVTDSFGSAVEERLASLQELLVAQDGLSHAEMDEIGYGLIEALAVAVAERRKELTLPIGIEMWSQRLQNAANLQIDAGYRALATRGPVVVTIQSQMSSPVAATYNLHVNAMIALNASIRFPFRLRVQDSDDMLDVRLRDVHPRMTSAVRLRINTWAGRLLSSAVDGLQTEARKALNGSAPAQ
jgi:Fic family protein